MDLESPPLDLREEANHSVEPGQLEVRVGSTHESKIFRREETHSAGHARALLTSHGKRCNISARSTLRPDAQQNSVVPSGETSSRLRRRVPCLDSTAPVAAFQIDHGALEMLKMGTGQIDGCPPNIRPVPFFGALLEIQAIRSKNQQARLYVYFPLPLAAAIGL